MIVAAIVVKASQSVVHTVAQSVVVATVATATATVHAPATVVCSHVANCCNFVLSASSKKRHSVIDLWF